MNPSIWAKQVREWQALKDKYNIGRGEIFWLLDHLYYPYTEHEVAQHLIRMYRR